MGRPARERLAPSVDCVHSPSGPHRDSQDSEPPSRRRETPEADITRHALDPDEPCCPHHGSLRQPGAQRITQTVSEGRIETESVGHARDRECPIPGPVFSDLYRLRLRVANRARQIAAEHVAPVIMHHGHVIVPNTVDPIFVQEE